VHELVTHPSYKTVPASAESFGTVEQFAPMQP
jgi:hypothetical protein